MTPRTCSYYDRRRRLRCTECNVTLDLCQCIEVEETAYKRLNTITGTFVQEVLREAQNFEHQPLDHLLERTISELGMVAMKLIQNDKDRSIPDTEVRHELVRLAATITLLAAIGTPEYAYPSDT
jgi:hypothetical protein